MEESTRSKFSERGYLRPNGSPNTRALAAAITELLLRSPDGKSTDDLVHELISPEATADEDAIDLFRQLTALDGRVQKDLPNGHVLIHKPVDRKAIDLESGRMITRKVRVRVITTDAAAIDTHLITAQAEKLGRATKRGFRILQNYVVPRHPELMPAVEKYRALLAQAADEGHKALVASTSPKGA